MQRIKQASRHSKSMTAFILKSIFRAMQYRTLIEQAEKLNCKNADLKVIKI